MASNWSTNNPTFGRWIARLHSHGPGLVTWVLVVAVAWQLGGLFWQFFPQPEPVIIPPKQITQSVQQTVAEQPAFDTDAILSAQLFGEHKPDVQSVAPVVTENIEETRLKLTLMGTIARASSEDGYAIIRDDKGNEKKYAVSDVITGRTKLHGVYARRVVLNRSGKLEELRLPTEFAATKSPTRRTSAAQRSQAELSELSEFMESNNADDLLKLTEVIRPVPKYDADGNLQGFRIYAGRQRRAFLKSGLRPGDLVTALNGQSFTSQAEIIKTLATIAPGSTVDISVDRNGEATSIQIDTNSILNLVKADDQPIS
ncbi:MAG: type II secretion system protein GspC [Gammaproteobacteria bacterium]|nr:type II secretion system protein GspC [Gammaproteobacteria bacterium]